MLDVTFELSPVERTPIEVSHPGFITLRGGSSEASSRALGQPSMILVDMVQVMAGVRLLFNGDARGFRVLAHGSTFELAFQRTGERTLALAAMGELVEHGDITQMSAATLEAARALWAEARPHLHEDDNAIRDIEAELEAFEGFVEGLRG